MYLFMRYIFLRPFFAKNRGKSIRYLNGSLQRSCRRGRQTAPDLCSRPGVKFIRRCRQMRVKITLACTECKQRNYNTKKNKKNDPDRLEMNKYCKFCRKHTLHKETK